LLALIDDTLKRMTQVLKRLKTLKGEMVPAIQEVIILMRPLLSFCFD